MAAIEIELHALNYMKFRSMARELRQLGSEGQRLRDEVRRRITLAGQPVVGEVRDAVMSTPSKGVHGGGNAQRRRSAVMRGRGIRVGERGAIARAGLRRSCARAVTLRQNRSGVAIILRASQLPAGQQTLPKRLNSAKGWRHPLFGDIAHWYHQPGYPYFDVTIKRSEERFRRACMDAVDKCLAEIGR